MKQPNYLAIVLAVAFGWYVYTHRDTSPAKPAETTIEQSVKQAYGPAFRKELSAVFLEASEQVKAGKFEYDRQLFDFVKERTEKAREDSIAKFHELLGKEVPSELKGKEAEVAKVFERVSKAWK